MKLCVLLLLALTACSASPVRFSQPDKGAPVFDLNPGRWPGTNDLIHPAEDGPQ